jgi:hypothetical protein
MVEQKSLQDVLNIVAAGLTDGTLSPKQENSGKKRGECGTSCPTFTEMDAFMAIDPLLADLNKRYLDAKAQHVQSISEYGADSPMTDMASWSEQSASCAVQTRLLELRSHQKTSQGAQELLMRHAEKERAEEQRAREKESIKTFEQMEMIARMHETKPQSSNAAWWMLFCLMAMTPEKPFRFYMPSHQFNRLAAA